MANKLRRLLAVGYSLCFLFSFGQDKDFDQMARSYYNNTVPLIYPNEVQEQFLLKNAPLILDTRKIEEFNVSHIQGAVYAGYSDFNAKLLDKITKDYPIVVYCTIGARSENIGEKLIKNGFSNVKNLYGGIIHWINSGYAVYDNDGKETDRVHVYSKKWGKWLKKGTAVY